MTDAINGMSWSVWASPWTIDAIVSTSNGDRCLLRAYDRFTVANRCLKVLS